MSCYCCDGTMSNKSYLILYSFDAVVDFASSTCKKDTLARRS